MSASPVLGRDARLLKGGLAIGYGKNISVKASAELIKAYSNDSLAPAVVGAGKQTFSWSMERLYTDKTYMALLLAGTSFDLIFAPEDTPITDTEYETWTNCVILNCERKAGENDAIIETISGEADGVVPAT